MWFIEARPGVIAWRSRGSTGGTLPGGGTGQRTQWFTIIGGAPQFFSWPKANGTGGAVAIGGKPWQWRAFNRQRSIFAWSVPTVPAPPPVTPRSTGAVFYVSLRMTSGVDQTGVPSSTSRPNEVAWIPSAQTPVGWVVINGQRMPVQIDQSWMRFHSHVADVRLGGRAAPSLPDVITTVETTQAAAVQSGQQVTALTHQSQTNAEALKATVEVVKNNSLTGSTQIPPVTLTPYDIP